MFLNKTFKNFVKGKKAEEQAYEELIFWILNLIFICVMLFFVYRISSSDAVLEETTAKSIALTIDSMIPGTETKINLHYLRDVAKGNDFLGDPVVIRAGQPEILVKLTSESKGFTFKTYSTIKRVDMTEDGLWLIIEV